MVSRAVIAAAAFALVALPVVAQTYPSKPIRLIVPFAPGGNIDITARTVAPGLSEALGQPVVVDNRGGAGGRIGTELAMKSAPDGYTLLLGSSGALTLTPAFFPSVTYNAVRDLAPTSLVSIVPLLLDVHPSLPIRSLKEFLAFAKANPGRLKMASAGAGSTTHIAGELFQLVAGIQLTHVPYKGSGPALIDLIAGQVDLIFDQISTSSTYIKAKRLRGIAVATLKRSSLLPEIPTMNEAGVPGFEASTYTAIFLPANTPKDIVTKVYTALTKVLDETATRESFARLGADVIKSTPEELTQRLTSDIAKWAMVQKRTNLKLE